MTYDIPIDVFILLWILFICGFLVNVVYYEYLKKGRSVNTRTTTIRDDGNNE